MSRHNDPFRRMGVEARRAHIRGAQAAVLLTRVGMRVIVQKEDGSEVKSLLAQLPSELKRGGWVASVEGMPGVHDCGRIRPDDGRAPQ